MNIAANEVKTATVVTFHDRGYGRESRYLVGGKVVLSDDPDREMLERSFCEEVEAQIAEGKTEGFTSHPCYPDWNMSTHPVTQ